MDALTHLRIVSFHLPNACVIVADKPQFMKVNDILKYNTDLTVKLLKRELESARQS